MAQYKSQRVQLFHQVKWIMVADLHSFTTTNMVADS